MSNIVADIEVRFSNGADSSAFYKIELDKGLNLDEKGKETSQFSPGDIINFLVHLGPELKIVRVAATNGTISKSGAVSRKREQFLDFAELDDTQQLNYIARGLLTEKWYGAMATGLSQSARILTISGGQLPALAKIKYQVPFTAYKLHTPKMQLAKNETYPIKIWVYLEAAT